jgi:hypothetical protein
MMTKTGNKIAALGFVLFTTAFMPFAKADEWDKKTIITTHEPIKIEGKVLGPGQYVMKLLESADRHIVQIYDVDDSKLEMTVMAIPVYRLDPTGDTRLTFAETADGQAPALRTWFYPGDNSGLEFSALR